MGNLITHDMVESDMPVFPEIVESTIEYNFSNDSIGAELYRLWSEFEIEFGKKGSDNCQSTLSTFCDRFLAVYKDWVPTEGIPNEIEVSESQRRVFGAKSTWGDLLSLSIRHIVPENSHSVPGFPLRFVYGILDWLVTITHDKCEVKDLHRIEELFEIITRSAHNRSLLVARDCGSFILNWINECMYLVEEFAHTNDLISLEDVYVSIYNLSRILHNFLPGPEQSSWCQFVNPFGGDSNRVSMYLNSIFGMTSSGVLSPMAHSPTLTESGIISRVSTSATTTLSPSTTQYGRLDCVIDCGKELAALTHSLLNFVRSSRVDGKWVGLLYRLLSVTANQLATSHKDPRRSESILKRIIGTLPSLGASLLGKNGVSYYSLDSVLGMNIAYMMLLMTAMGTSEVSRNLVRVMGGYDHIVRLHSYVWEVVNQNKSVDFSPLEETPSVVSVSVPNRYLTSQSGIASLPTTNNSNNNNVSSASSQDTSALVSVPTSIFAFPVKESFPVGSALEEFTSKWEIAGMENSWIEVFYIVLCKMILYDDGGESEIAVSVPAPSVASTVSLRTSLATQQSSLLAEQLSQLIPSNTPSQSLNPSASSTSDEPLLLMGESVTVPSQQPSSSTSTSTATAAAVVAPVTNGSTTTTASTSGSTPSSNNKLSQSIHLNRPMFDKFLEILSSIDSFDRKNRLVVETVLLRVFHCVCEQMSELYMIAREAGVISLLLSPHFFPPISCREFQSESVASRSVSAVSHSLIPQSCLMSSTLSTTSSSSAVQGTTTPAAVSVQQKKEGSDDLLSFGGPKQQTSTSSSSSSQQEIKRDIQITTYSLKHDDSINTQISIALFVRNEILDFVFSVLPKLPEHLAIAELSTLLQLIPSSDDLFIMLLACHLTPFFTAFPNMIFPSHFMDISLAFVAGTLSSSSSSSSTSSSSVATSASLLKWSAQYSLISLIDSLMNSFDRVVSLILPQTIGGNEAMRAKTVDALFVLLSSHKTVEFGSTFVLHLLRCSASLTRADPTLITHSSPIFTSFSLCFSRIRSDRTNTFADSILHVLLHMMDFLLSDDVELISTIQSLLCESSIFIHVLSVANTDSKSDHFLSLFEHLLVTVQLLLHHSPTAVKAFKETIGLEQLNALLTSAQTTMSERILLSFTNLMFDQFIFDSRGYLSALTDLTRITPSMTPNAYIESLSLSKQVKSISELLTAHHSLIHSLLLEHYFIVYVYVQSLTKCAKSLQHDGLRLLIGVLVNNNGKLNIMMSGKAEITLMDALIRTMPLYEESNIPSVLELIELIARHFINVPQLSHLLSLLHGTGEYRSKYILQIVNLINSLYQMVSNNRPDHSYLFIPPNSGLELVTKSLIVPAKGAASIPNQRKGILCFPPHGYSFSTWLCIDSMDSDWMNSQDIAIPHILHIADSNGNSLSLQIQDISLSLTITQNKVVQPIPPINYPIQPQVWNHITIVHGLANRAAASGGKNASSTAAGAAAATATTQGRGYICIYLNGQNIFENVCVYPSFVGSPRVFIGTRGETYNTPTGLTIRKEQTELQGEVGSIYLFNRLLSHQQAEGLFLLGANYKFNFESLNVDKRRVNLSTIASSHQPSNRRQGTHSPSPSPSTTSSTSATNTASVIGGGASSSVASTTAASATATATAPTAGVPALSSAGSTGPSTTASLIHSLSGSSVPTGSSSAMMNPSGSAVVPSSTPSSSIISTPSSSSVSDVFSDASTAQTSAAASLGVSESEWSTEGLLMSDVESLKNKSIIHSLGLSPEKVETVLSVLDGSLYHTILLNFSSCVVSSDASVSSDLSPLRGRSQRWNTLTQALTQSSTQSKDKDTKVEYVETVEAMLLGNTVVSTTRQINAILECLGGIALFFPLISQMDLKDPISNSYVSDTSLSVGIIQLICDAVKTNPQAQRYMLTNAGFDVLAYLLSKIAPKNLNDQVFTAIIRLSTSESLVPALRNQIFQSFFSVNSLTLWVYCPISLQQKIMNYLCDCVMGRGSTEIAQMIRIHIGIEGLCHLICYQYSGVSVNESDIDGSDWSIISQWLRSEKSYHHSLNGEVVGERASVDEMKSVLEILFKILNVFALDANMMTPNACCCVLTTIVWSVRHNHSLILSHIHRLLLSILQTDSLNIQFLKNTRSFTHVMLDVEWMNRMLKQNMNAPAASASSSSSQVPLTQSSMEKSIDFMGNSVSGSVSELASVYSLISTLSTMDLKKTNGGIVPVFILLLELNKYNVEMCRSIIRVLLHIVWTCQQSPENVNAWECLGVSKMRIPMLWSYISNQYMNSEIVNEELMASIMSSLIQNSNIFNNNNSALQLVCVVPLFFQLLCFLPDERIEIFFNEFINLFLNSIHSVTNLANLQSLTDWDNYIFEFLFQVKVRHPLIFRRIWGVTQSFIQHKVTCSLEKFMYQASNTMSGHANGGNELSKFVMNVFAQVFSYLHDGNTGTIFPSICIQQYLTETGQSIEALAHASSLAGRNDMDEESDMMGSSYVEGAMMKDDDLMMMMMMSASSGGGSMSEGPTPKNDMSITPSTASLPTVTSTEVGQRVKNMKSSHYVAELYVTMVNVLINQLTMPGDKSLLLLCIQPLVTQLMRLLVSMTHVTEDEILCLGTDSSDIFHFFWQLTHPMIKLLTSVTTLLYQNMNSMAASSATSGGGSGGGGGSSLSSSSSQNASSSSFAVNNIAPSSLGAMLQSILKDYSLTVPSESLVPHLASLSTVSSLQLCSELLTMSFSSLISLLLNAISKYQVIISHHSLQNEDVSDAEDYESVAANSLSGGPSGSGFVSEAMWPSAPPSMGVAGVAPSTTSSIGALENSLLFGGNMNQQPQQQHPSFPLSGMTHGSSSNGSGGGIMVGGGTAFSMNMNGGMKPLTQQPTMMNNNGSLTFTTAAPGTNGNRSSNVMDDLLNIHYNPMSQPLTQPSALSSLEDNLLGGMNMATQPLTQPTATTGIINNNSNNNYMDLLSAQPPTQQTTPPPNTQSLSHSYSVASVDRVFRPLFNEAVEVIKSLNIVVEMAEFPRDDLQLMRRLSDLLRTVEMNCGMNENEDFRSYIRQLLSTLSYLIEEKCRKSLSELEGQKPKRKWLLTDKQKASIAKNEEIGKLLNQFLITPTSEWSTRNVLLTDMIRLMELPPSDTLSIDKIAIPTYIQTVLLYSSADEDYINTLTPLTQFAITELRSSEYKSEMVTLNKHSHSWWRKRQLVIRKWSLIIDALAHERATWGQLTNKRGILTVSPHVDSLYQHRFILSDITGTTHPEASTWKSGVEEPEKEQKTSESVGVTSKLQNISIEAEMSESNLRQLEQDLLRQSLDQARILFSQECLFIRPMLCVKGQLELTGSTLSFTVSEESKNEFEANLKALDVYYNNPEKKRDGINKYKLLSLPDNSIWSLSELVSEEYRLFQFRQTAIELFFSHGSSIFISFNSSNTRETFHAMLSSLHPRNLRPFTGRTVSERFANDDSMKKWLKREMSTFDYIMALNRIAGRTYNDLAQYPVFPWVIADYESEVLDLTNSKTFRDFSYSMGGQVPERRELLQERYKVYKEEYEQSRGDITDDPLGISCPPPRHFSTHYSNSAGVLWYLIRLEPYTSLHIFLQDGKFDRPDRQFWSIANCYYGCTHNDGDIKELIPEFYYMPDFLKNVNEINLGVRQDVDHPITHVELPKWARTAEEFIQINRDALESEYVSYNLHQWIDLVFGWKQQGMEGEKCMNILHHVSYYGQLDMNSLFVNQPDLFKQAASMLDNFGQTPLQIFTTPHKLRRALTPVPLPLLSRHDWTTVAGVGVMGQSSTPPQQQWPPTELMLVNTGVKVNGSVVCVRECKSLNSIITFTPSRTLNSHPIKFPPSKSLLVELIADPRIKLNHTLTIGEPLSNSLDLRVPSISKDQLVSTFHSLPFLLVSGFWDNTLKCINVNNGSNEWSVNVGDEVVTCVSVCRDDSHIVVGSTNNSVTVFKVEGSNTAVTISGSRTLYGHDDVVLCVAIDKELDLICSASRDGTLILYSLSKSTYIRTLSDPIKGVSSPVDWCAITHNACICWYSSVDYTFRLQSITGDVLFRREMTCNLNSLILSTDTDYVIAGGDNRVLYLMKVNGFVDVNSSQSQKERYVGQGKPPQFDLPPTLPSAIRSLTLSNDESYLFIGLDSGDVYAVASKSKPTAPVKI